MDLAKLLGFSLADVQSLSKLRREVLGWEESSLPLPPPQYSVKPNLVKEFGRYPKCGRDKPSGALLMQPSRTKANNGVGKQISECRRENIN